MSDASPIPPADDKPGLAIRRATDRCFHEVEEIVDEGYIVQGVLIPHEEVVETRRLDDAANPPACVAPLPGVITPGTRRRVYVMRLPNAPQSAEAPAAEGTAMSLDPAQWVAKRATEIDASGIRKVFDLAAKLKDPINLSIGQPDFDVPDLLKDRAIEAIKAGKNRYTPTQGIAELINPIKQKVTRETGWNDPGVLILSGTSAGIMLAMFATLNPGDEVLFMDPYFVMYKHLPRMCGAVPVPVDTYPDFRLHADRLKKAITPRSKLLVLCSPNNPTGITYTAEELKNVAEIAKKHGLLVVSDEIYDGFCYETHHSLAKWLPEQCIQLKGYSKTYGMTGWRLGYAAAAGAAKGILDQMTKLQQYTFVCAPSMVQYAALETVLTDHVDMTPFIDAYRRKRDKVVDGLKDLFEINHPGGAFYVFPKAPGGLTGAEFVGKAIERNLLIIPGGVFSDRDTHFRISYATSDEKLDQGIAVLRELAREAGR